MISGYFVCVGAQKSGTSWLLAALGQHPDIFATPVKEIHYFDHLAGITRHLANDRRRSRFRKYLQHLAFDWPHFGEYRRQWRWYRAYMASPIDDTWYELLFSERGGATIAGEATPEYALIGRDGYTHIKRLAPDARVIFVMRSPFAQAWSQFLHFEHRKDARGASGRAPAEYWESAYSAPFRDYARTIDDLRAVFGNERVRFLFYENVHADRAGAIRSLCAFLGIAYEARYFIGLEKSVNVSRPVPIPPELRAALTEDQRRVATQVRDRLGTVPDAWLEEADL